MESVLENKILQELYETRKTKFETNFVKKIGNIKEIQNFQKTEESLENILKSTIKNPNELEKVLESFEDFKMAEIEELEEKYGEKFKEIFKSMTTDNRHEFLNYDKIEISKLDEKKRRTVVYYTDPYSSWQKGMNENCNGILRRFIPKGTDLNKISSEKLVEILNKINGKPRKILGFVSAEKKFNEELEKIVA